MAKRLWATVFIASLSAPAWSQTPVGAEFRANEFTTGNQATIGVASDADGDVLVVWNSFAQDGYFFGIFGRHYDSSGAPLTGEFQINAYTTHQQRFPAVTADANGNFVVVWQSMGPDGNGYAVVGRRVDAAGPVGQEFAVNTYITANQGMPALAPTAGGNFVVVWHSGIVPGNSQDGSGYGIFGQRISASGNRVGFEFQVSTYTTGNQFGPAVSSDPEGDFVVAWTGNYQDGNNDGVFAQRYDANGVRQGDEFRVNTFTFSIQRRPAVASDVNGNFVVAWEGRGADDPSNYGVFAQRFDSAGVAQGAEFRVNAFTTGDQVAATVAYGAPGEFVVAWQSFDIIAQRFSAAGLPTGEFRANTNTTFGQSFPKIAADPSGGFTVAWQSQGQDGDLQGIYGQRFSSDLIFRDGFE